MRPTPEIIAAMQRLAVEQRKRLGDRAPWHIGDIAWGRWQHPGREGEWDFRVWDDMAWAWLRFDSGLLDYDVHDDHLDLLDEVLADPRARSAHAFADDAERLGVFARHGFVTPGSELHFNSRAVDGAPPLPALPDGFRCRTVEDADFVERVAVHRAAWEPSRLTEESYANVQAAWPYRQSLDCVVEAPDGRFAASVILWPDDENGVGELEPVGVRPEFRRLGLGAAVCTFALRRWFEEGGRRAIVYCESEPACALYASIGFARAGTLVEYSR